MRGSFQMLVSWMILGSMCSGIVVGERSEIGPEITRIIPEEEDEVGASDDKDSPPWWIIVAIPFVSAIVGYVTNVIALKMTFYPVEFWGLKLWQPEGQPFGLFGWQGIIPAKAKIMAGRMMDLFLDKLIDVSEIFGRLDPSIMAYYIKDGANAIFRDALSSVAKDTMPGVWDSLTENARQDIISYAEQHSEEFIKGIMLAMRSNILKILDLKGLAERRAEENKGMMANMFMEIGRRECRFIELSGLFFGFLFGVFQALLYCFYQGPWVLPVAGLLVGLLTNYIALKAIFEPAEERNILGIKIQGLFLRRQHEAAKEIACLAQRDFLSPGLLVDEMLHGRKQEAFRRLLHSVCQEYTQESLVAWLLLGTDTIQQVRNIVVQIVLDRIEDAFPKAYPIMEEHMDIERTLTSKIREMTPTDFIGLLRPAFEEEELKLIVVGGVLGLAVGVIQQFALVPIF